MSPIANTSGWPGRLRSGSTTRRPPRVVGVPSVAASPSARTPVAHTIVPAAIVVPSLRCTSSLSTRPHAGPQADVDAAARQRAQGPAPTTAGSNGVSSRSAISTRVMRAGGDRQLREVLGQHHRVQLAQPAGHLDPGRPATADDDVEAAGRRDRRIGSGLLEAGQDVDAQRQRVLEVLERQRVLHDARDAEVVADGAGGDDERRRSRGRSPSSSSSWRASRSTLADAGHPHADVGRPAAAAAHAAADRVGDVLGIQAGGRDLVQQRLERVEVVGVEQCHVDPCAEQRPRRSEAAEAGTDDDDVRSPARADARRARPSLVHPHRVKVCDRPSHPHVRIAAWPS